MARSTLPRHLTRRPWAALGQLVWAVAVAGSLLVGLRGGASAAQGWTPRLLLSTTSTIADPSVSADAQGDLNVFWTVHGAATAEDKSPLVELDYARRGGESWSQPVTVYAAPSINSPDSAIDQYGFLHVFWQGAPGVLLSGSAPLNRATSAAGWSP